MSHQRESDTPLFPEPAIDNAKPRFVWPPRAIDLDARDTIPIVDGEPEAMTPPPHPDASVSQDTSVQATHWRRTLGRMLRAAEQEWLGIADVAWHEAAARARWVADTPDAYCPRCGTSVGPFEADADGCPACRKRRLAWVRAVRLGEYRGVLRDAILAAKYTAWRRVGQELGADLGKTVAATLRESGIDPATVAVCPVATSTRRRLARGVDHTVVLAREVARETGGTLVRGLFRKHRPPQTGLSGSARQRNMAKSFRYRASASRRLGDRVIVLVDDVRTSGATLSAAARAIQRGLRELPEGRTPTIWVASAAVTARGEMGRS